MYVRVYGHLKSFQGVRQLVAFSVRHVFQTFFLVNSATAVYFLLVSVN